MHSTIRCVFCIFHVFVWFREEYHHHYHQHHHHHIYIYIYIYPVSFVNHGCLPLLVFMDPLIHKKARGFGFISNHDELNVVVMDAAVTRDSNDIDGIVVIVDDGGINDCEEKNCQWL